MTYLTSRIHDISLDFGMSARKFMGKMTDIQLLNEDRVPLEGDILLQATLVLLNQNDYVSVMELITNKWFQPVYIGGLSEMDGYYYVNVSTEEAKGGEKNVWMVKINMDYAGEKETWNVSGREVPTHWDTIEEWTTSDPSWTNENGTYSWNATTHMELDGTERARSDEIELWDGNYRISVDMNSGGDNAGHHSLLFRKAGTTGDYCYEIQVDQQDDEVRFTIQNGGETIMKTWSLTITYNVNVNVIVDCRGNRFDVYLDNAYVGTIWDDTFKCGFVAYENNISSGSAFFVNTIITQTKPITASLPVGAADINQMRMAGTNQLNDDTTDDGSVNIIVSPDNPVEFKHSGSVYGGGEVKVYDTLGSTTEADWRRVYDMDRNFVGNIIIDNGLIRMSLAGQSYIKDFTMSVYSNSAWENVEFNPSWSSLTFENVDYGITKLERYIVVLREASYWETAAGMDMVWTDYTLRSGSRMIEIENVRSL